MKNFKYIGLFVLSLSIASCDVNNDLDAIPEEVAAEVALNTNGLDFSSYVSVGASFTAGFTDNGLFKAAQENSFPNILASKFGTTFNQPLMNDNIGGLLYGGVQIQGPRFYFDGSGPAPLDATPTTETTSVLSGSFNNYGIPGAKSFHFVASGYGNLQGVPLELANPYYARFASSASATVLGDAVAQAPTFFTLSEIGGNDVLGYALAGGAGVDQTGNFDVTSYGSSDITDPTIFGQVFGSMVTALTATGAKGVVANLPYITSLANFTTVPYNPLDATGSSDSSVALAAQIPTLNVVYGGINQVFTALGETDRIIQFSLETPNPVIIKDEDLTDLSAQITGGLMASPTFPAFVQQFGLPAEAAPLVASLFGQFYGQARPATSNDLLVLSSSSVIGTINTDTVQYLMSQGLSQTLAGQFSAEGISLPLEDKWVITPEEQAAIKTATDAYNTTISSIASANPNLALVDFKAILEEASTGIAFDDYVLTTNLVTGGLISLDGVHLTARGYALMANKFLAAMDAEFGSNFTTATGGLAVGGDYPTNYSPALR
ncbi:G-D-S-L family lipolytic protein [Polaribacter reichenbachii]|uniref:G-D-S-L family lipolytic protein n=1 Tax=Polaribacter reichenbachii TaxID=996801 RepID=A0A1B8TV17_9FLAO|nr:G-D-S-L family lipolytic protein [Polaribacter reichenbachii]APZ45659.1 G-D-S-L family lipolytic protein [Polaribacter reichenbachii]AUC19521.1 G-D-S-L family lipolytic protein [Polaribacter reichenbachii]OBY63325.1 G-D-S-L family lipolytic protein [Polaribacter reichenbachii]